MGFLEKLKNTFFEEEYVEVEEKPKEKKKENKKVEVPLPKEEVEVAMKVEPVKKEEVAPPRVKKEETFIEEEKVERRTEKFHYFDDDDFLDFEEDVYQKPVTPPKSAPASKPSLDTPKLYDNPAYGAKKTSVSSSSSTPYGKAKDTKSTFRPTPIISPIYGILDKNYTKEEVIEKREIKPSSSYVSRKNADLDSVREKAFGSMMSDFDLVRPGEEPVVAEEAYVEEEAEDNLLFDMTDVSKTPSVDKVTLQDAEEYFQDLGLEYNVDYKDAKLEKVTGRRVSKTPKLDEIEEEDISHEEEIIFPMEEEKKSRTDQSLEDNLFDLIDSMYEEKE